MCKIEITNAGMKQDEFYDENVPSCYLTVWRLYTTYLMQSSSSSLDIWAVIIDF